MNVARPRGRASRQLFSADAIKLRFGFARWIPDDGIEPNPPATDGPLTVRIVTSGRSAPIAQAARAAIAQLSSEGMEIAESGDGIVEIHVGTAGLDLAMLRALAAGRVLVGGFPDAAMFVAPWDAPVCATADDNLESVLRWLAANRAAVAAIGSQGVRYVRCWHSRKAALARLLAGPYAVEGLAARYHIAAVIAGRTEDPAEPPDWLHPFRVGCRADLSSAAQGRDIGNLSTAIEISGSSATFRWWLAQGREPPRAGWASYDRRPWRHPWLIDRNIMTFADFSRQTMASLSARTPGPNTGRYAFVGNLANASYMRAAGLIRTGLEIDVHLHPDDRSIQSQPYWEDFGGTIRELGIDPARTAFEQPLPSKVFRIQPDPNWGAAASSIAASPLDPADILTFSAFAANYPQFQALARYDAALYCQIISFAPFARRPWIVAPTGGDIWFDPSRADAYGKIARRALRDAYAVIVSNPITLAHARRYGIRNLLYLPFCIDETRYFPGAEPGLRMEWTERSGGDFFVLCTMRLDNLWKGSDIALEGFAAFSRNHPAARLVLTSWGNNEAQSRTRLAELGIAEKVIVEPLCGKARLAKMLRGADAFIEQFVLGYYGASGLEALASGLPVIMRLERAQYDALVPAGAPPVLDAQDAAEVAAHLSQLYADPARRADIAGASRDWFMRTHASQACAAGYSTLLAAAASGQKIDWSKSPLSAPLAAAEIAHHDAQLADAPVFPNYEI